MTESLYSDHLGDMVERARVLQASLNAMIDAYILYQGQNSLGKSVVVVLDDFTMVELWQHRRAIHQASTDYQNAFNKYRSVIIRVLVDEEHLTFSEVARRMGVSRQMATRLYSSVGRAADQPE